MTLEKRLIHSKHLYIDNEVPFRDVLKLAKLCDKLEKALRVANNSYVGIVGQPQIDEALRDYQYIKL